MEQYLLAIDQGTSSTRAIIFNAAARVISQHHIEFKQYFPQNAWVEHDPEEIWQTVIQCCKSVLEKASLSAKDIHAMGISNQRETTILWDKETGEPIYPAIVWQDRRTAQQCLALAEQDKQNSISHKTGLIIDPYFSATKISWILNHVHGARQKALDGKILFGTIDTFLLWRFTGGKIHATDASNASRTMLFNIHTQEWDNELLQLMNIPKNILPAVCDNTARFGETDTALLGHAISICAMAGDQQAAAFGQGCFQPGMMKSTYGTGCFISLNTGDCVIRSKNRLLSTVAYRINNHVTYGLEGSIFVAGAAVQWLRDTLHLISTTKETAELAQQISDTAGVYLVPAFTGLGAPYWDPLARGALVGLTRDSGIPHIVRATLEAACYQTRDLLEAMIKDGAAIPTMLRVDGGMAANDWLLQFLADILNITVKRAAIIETSALGAALMAGLGSGLYTSLNEIGNLCQFTTVFQPTMPAEKRKQLYQGWLNAVTQVCRR